MMEEAWLPLAVGVSTLALFAGGFTLLMGRLFGTAYSRSKFAVQSARLPNNVRKALNEAKYYGQAIKKTAAQCPPGPIQSHLDNLTIKHVKRSLDSLARFERALINLHQHTNLRRETQRARGEAERLRRQVLAAKEADRPALQKILDSKKEHLAALQELQSFQEQVTLEVQRIASDLATAHTEMLLIVTRGDFNRTRLQQIDEHLQEHLSSLRDMVSTIDELDHHQSAQAK